MTVTFRDPHRSNTRRAGIPRSTRIWCPPCVLDVRDARSMERLDWPQIASPRVHEFLTVKEVAELLKLNPQTVQNWI
jgi:hypothetical protein